MISITPAANLQISKLCNENNCYAIGLELRGGGCAGFEYHWSTMQSEQVEKHDYVIECDYGHLVIGSHSLLFLVGTEIDYKKTIVGSTFEIRNPNAKSSCGCGTSVNFEYEEVVKNNSGVVNGKTSS